MPILGQSGIFSPSGGLRKEIPRRRFRGGRVAHASVDAGPLPAILRQPSPWTASSRSAIVGGKERCESGRIGLTANELAWETGPEGSNPSLSAQIDSPVPPRGTGVQVRQ